MPSAGKEILQDNQKVEEYLPPGEKPGFLRHLLRDFGLARTTP
jgi:hypothetical protein